jgi:hypothetical protein
VCVRACVCVCVCVCVCLCDMIVVSLAVSAVCGHFRPHIKDHCMHAHKYGFGHAPGMKKELFLRVFALCSSPVFPSPVGVFFFSFSVLDAATCCDVCVCVCVCVCEYVRDRERERERVCVCVCCLWNEHTHCYLISMHEIHVNNCEISLLRGTRLKPWKKLPHMTNTILVHVCMS